MINNNRKIKNLTVFLTGLAVFFVGCKEAGRLDHIDKNAPAPAQVSNVEVFNTWGGATLKYTLPTDDNLLYVQAIYEIRPGVQRETKASYIIDSLFLEGFGDTRAYEVKLYSVGRNGKKSEPLTETVYPKTAPVHLATKDMRPTFGGVAIDLENEQKANLAIVLLADTAKLGYLTEVFVFYTATPSGTFRYRGLDSIPYDFAIYLRDRWDNLSDTLKASVTPWFEQFIPTSTWREYTLLGDAPPIDASYVVSKIWDGQYGGPMGGGVNYHSDEQLTLPQIITWDLGVKVQLSRMRLYPRNHSGGDDTWTRGHPRVFEIYGSLAPSSSGALDETWLPLGKFECVKPSGEGTQITEEDYAYALAGIDFDFEESDFAPDPNTPVRYIRFRTLTTYANTLISPVSIQEIMFWGTIVE